MGLDGNRTSTDELEPRDLNQRQDNIIKEIREKEKPSLIKRVFALLRYFINRDYRV